MSTPGTAAQPFTLLRTKLHKPQVRPDWVRRPRLEKRLDQGLDRKLTLVSAPAGFGKSSLVASSLAESDRHATWLSLDESDNDPVRFWTYVIAAIQAVEQDVGNEARQIIASPQLRRTDPIIISLLNEISELTDDLVLVLDDYHVIEAGQIHEGLSYLLDHQPANLHIVLITRADPPISLARLRAHGRLVEIRATDLEFSAAEAALLFNDVMNLNLKAGQVAALTERTEGWIVGLQLAALSLQANPSYEAFIEQFTGSHQFVLDYLTEEVLSGLPDAHRQFLLRTSILERLCGALCRAVTGNTASNQLLDEIWKGNLFLIPLDASGLWFRYHHLFADVLRSLLERDHADEIGSLHERAAAWFESEGYLGEAVDHALRSGDMAQAKALILQHWAPIVYGGQVRTVLRWLDALPEELAREDPFVPLARCWALFVSGQSLAIEAPLEQANVAYERLISEGSLSGTLQGLAAGQLAMMRSVLARVRGEHADSAAHAEQAVRLVPPDMLESSGSAWNMLARARAEAGDIDGAIEAYGRGIELQYRGGNLVGACMCTYRRAMYMVLQGRLSEAGAACRSAMERAVREGHGDLPATGWLHLAMGEIELERFRLDRAEAYLNDGLRIARSGGLSEVRRLGHYLRAQLATARGDRDSAVDALHGAERIVSAMDDPHLSGELAMEWATLYLNAGDLDAARRKLALLEGKSTVTQHAILHLARDWIPPRLLCAEGRYDEALAELDGTIHRTRAANSKGELVRLLALQAVAFAATGSRQAACSVLREAAALSAPDGYVRRWLDAGPSIGPLLRELRHQGDTPVALHPYLDGLLDACRSTFGDLALQPAAKMLDPLTARELEVMRLICAGYTNPEIAGELVVTLNTIKKHTSNIYGKLGVRGRTQAIARVHELNLL